MEVCKSGVYVRCSYGVHWHFYGQLTALKENPGSGILQFSSTPEPEPVLRQPPLDRVLRYAHEQEEGGNVHQ